MRDMVPVKLDFEEMKRFIAPLFLGLGLILISAGCDGDSGSSAAAPKVRMTIDAQNFTPLKEGFTYKAWARVGGVYLSADAFNVTETGQLLTSGSQLRDKSFVFEGDITDADLIVISIEGKTGAGEVPSQSIMLAADVTGVTELLTTSHSAALGGSLSSQTGQLTVMTPSDIDTSNEASGIWFLTVSGATMTKGLSLPTLNEGWVYEGWIETGGARYSTGRFSSNTSLDTNLYSFPDSPPFPGEDFLINPPTGVTFPLNLDGGKVLITAEPEPDDSIAPSGIVVLTAQLPSTVVGGSVHQLVNTELALPTATISIF